METRNLFLEIIKSALYDQQFRASEYIEPEKWYDLLMLARKHNVMPMVFQSIYGEESFITAVGLEFAGIKRSVMQEVFGQIQRTSELTELYSGLVRHGLTPIVLKGAIVRNIYPNPDNRISTDEDFYIPLGSYYQYKQILAECGMTIAPWDSEKEDSCHEITFVNTAGILQIEIHKDLFDSKLGAFKGMSDLFEDTFEKSVFCEVNGVEMRTMNHTDHMLFLILHAFKHFVSSGFGIRQVCDLVMYGNTYGYDIDWLYLLRKCKDINADIFAAALFRIGYEYLGFDCEKARYPKEWKDINPDIENILNDLIDAGVFGASDMNRKHSGNMTLSAVSAEKEGKKKTNHIVKTVFPPVELLEGRYTYLQKHKALLPLAWTQRIIDYRKQIKKKNKDNNIADALKIGRERVELLQEYGIIR